MSARRIERISDTPLVLRLNNFYASVIAAVGTHAVRNFRLFAMRTERRGRGTQGKMRAPLVAPRTGYPSFW